MDPASAIEKDVHCFLSDNDCCLKPLSPCINISDQFNLNSSLIHKNDFVNDVYSKMINAKDRKVIGGYPAIKALYKTYLDPTSYCGGSTNRQLTYSNLIRFMRAIDDVWIDIMEQLIPSTAIWGSVELYRNTVFDSEKFIYKRYTVQSCPDANNLPLNISCSNVLSQNTGVTVTRTVISESTGETISNPCSGDDVDNIGINCDHIYITHINDSAEHVGFMSVVPIDPIIVMDLGDGPVEVILSGPSSGNLPLNPVPINSGNNSALQIVKGIV